MENTVQFSISNKNLNCMDVVKTLMKCNINASVTENVTTICNAKKCWLEKGCKITTSNMERNQIKNLWNYIKFKHGLNCCHLKIEQDFQGCIKDYIQDSNCK